MKIEKREINSQEVQDLAKKFQIDLITASILVRRGQTRGDQLKFMLEDDLAYLHSPFLFNQMEHAVERTLRAVEEEERVLIFGDRDVDGITSTVMLTDHLHSMGLTVSWRLPSKDDPYGISRSAIDEFAQQDGSLIFTVDCGITANEEVSYAKSLGIDTIILDHHIPGEHLPEAEAIINPKMEDSGYPFSGLAGCAVTGKFLYALIFSQTQFFNRDVVLLHCEPYNETIKLEAIKIRNLVEIDSTLEFINPGFFQLESSKLYRNFLQGQQLFVYQKEVDLPLLERALQAEIHAYPIMDELVKFFPSIKGQSLLRLSQKSRSVLYQEGERSKETKLFIHLFSLLLLKEGKVHETFQKNLDLIAIGTIADMMPLYDENRILVKQGLKLLEKDPRPSLALLLAKNKLLGKRITSKDIGWNISPIINATGRLGVPEVAVNYLKQTDQTSLEEQVEELISINKERRKLGDQAFTKIKNKVFKILEEYDNQIIVSYEPDIERGVTGIIAARLMKEYGLPVIIMTDVPTGVVGSARSPEGIHIQEFLERFQDLLIDFGGHPCAGGFSLERENLDTLLKGFQKEAKGLPKREKKESIISVDASIPSKYMVPSILTMIDTLGPFGESFPSLNFEVFGVIQDLKVIGSGNPGHLRVTLKTDANSWPGVFWNSADRVEKDFAIGDSVRIICKIGRNYFQQVETPQLTILDIERK